MIRVFLAGVGLGPPEDWPDDHTFVTEPNGALTIRAPVEPTSSRLIVRCIYAPGHWSLVRREEAVAT